jgi:hypothetical protein
LEAKRYVVVIEGDQGGDAVRWIERYDGARIAANVWIIQAHFRMPAML